MHATRFAGSCFLVALPFACFLHAGCASGGAGDPASRGPDVSRSGPSSKSAGAVSNPALREIERRRSGFTASDFVDVAGNWDVDLVRLYLDAGADPNAPHKFRTTAIGEAAHGDRGETITLLVSRGARPNDYSQDESPLYIAATLDRLNALEALIAAKADLNQPRQPNMPGETALCDATHFQRWDAARLLLEAGADPNLAPEGNSGPIVAAAQEGHLPTVRLLLEKGAKGPDLATALYAAILQGRADVVRFLLEAGVPVPEDRNALVGKSSDIDPEVKKLLAKPPKPGTASKGQPTAAPPSVPSSPKAVANVLMPGEAEGQLQVQTRGPKSSLRKYPLKHACALRQGGSWYVVLADRPLESKAVDAWIQEKKLPKDPKLHAVAVVFNEERQGTTSQFCVGGQSAVARGSVLEAGPFDGRAISGRLRTNAPGVRNETMFLFRAAFVAPLPAPWSDGVTPEEAAQAEGTAAAMTFRAYEKAVRERDVSTLARIVPEAFGPGVESEAIRESLLAARGDQLRDTKLKVQAEDGESASLLVVGKDEDGWPRQKVVNLKKKGSDWTMGL